MNKNCYGCCFVSKPVKKRERKTLELSVIFILLSISLCGIDVVRSEFGKGGLPTTDSKRFNAHLTIAKTSKSYVRSIPSSSYSHLHDINFGVDSFDGLELLSMSRPEDRDGYYYCFKKCSF